MQAHPKRAARLERTRHPGIYRRGSKYVVTWRHRGRQHKQTYPTLAAARIAKRERQAGNTQPNSTRLTLGAYAQEWFETYNGRTGQGIADTTRQDYRRSLETYVLPTLGGVRLSHLEPRDVRALVRALEDRGMRPSSVVKNVSALKALLSTAVEDGLIQTNPAAVVRIASRRAGEFDDHTRRRALRRDELHRLLDAVDDDWRLLLEFLVFTGLRISEAIGLTWDAVELGDKPRIHVRQQVYRGRIRPPKSRYGVRTIPLAERIAQPLRQRRDDTNPSSERPVFATAAGGFLDGHNLRHRVLRPAVRDAGLDGVGFHTLRHTCASLLFESGKNAKQVQMWLGHHDPGFTLSTYVHLLDQGLGEVGFIDSVLAPNNHERIPQTEPLGGPVESGAGDRLHVDAGR